MKTINIIATLALVLLLTNCNKEKKLMERLEGNWSIEASEKILYRTDGTTEAMETISNAGKLVISGGSSDEIKQYDLFYVGVLGDTIQVKNELVTDEYNTRMIMLSGYADSTGNKNLVWTIEKEKKNKQVWTTYGVDSTLFYPANNHNPGAAQNWVKWKITLKRE